MVIDVDHEAALDTVDPRALHVAAFHDDHGVGGVADLADDVNVRHAGEHQQRRWRRIAAHDPDILAELPQRIGHRQR